MLKFQTKCRSLRFLKQSVLNFQLYHLSFRIFEDEFPCGQSHRMMIVFAIEIIADDRQSMMRKMVSDLMCTSRKDFQFKFHNFFLCAYQAMRL